jgi:hypothetical protein
MFASYNITVIFRRPGLPMPPPDSDDDDDRAPTEDDCDELPAGQHVFVSPKMKTASSGLQEQPPHVDNVDGFWTP